MVIQWHLMGFTGIYDGDSMAFNGVLMGYMMIYPLVN